MIGGPPRSTQSRSSAASDVYKRQADGRRRAFGIHACAQRRHAQFLLDIVGPPHQLRRHAPDSSELLHLESEAIKLAWELRNRHIADPEFSEVPVDELLSKKMTSRLASTIDMNKALDIETVMRRSDTIYLTVVDKKRMAVSFINSVYYGFGSGIVTPKTGIALQNRGACFVPDPKPPNCIGPAKRPNESTP